MGKPFEKELRQLTQTYEWAKGDRENSAEVEKAANALRSTFHLPLIAVGSGGSFSAAELQATLHRSFLGSMAMAVTPLEMISVIPEDGKVSIWMLSASGNNIDIRRAFQHAALMEPESINAVVGRKESKLSQLQKRYEYTNVFEYPIPSGKDGFLASNSLLAHVVLLYRFYSQLGVCSRKLPPTIEELISQAMPKSPSLTVIQEKTDSIWKQKVIHIIYSNRLKSVAIDIESKLIEAGLGSVHLADMRNFAHGRHHWFDKNPEGSGLLFLSTTDEQELAEKTRKLFPVSIAKEHLTFTDLDGIELIAGIVLSLYIALWRGRIFDIDPGQPGIPDYGYKIYNLTAKSGFISSIKKEMVASRRKSKATIQLAKQPDWLKAYRQFSRRLSKQIYHGLVLDYDGTVVDSRNKENPPNTDICREFNRLLACGLTLGFATGRGKSIRQALQCREAIDKKYWDKVIIGYYNGAEIGYLSDGKCPNSSFDTGYCFNQVLEYVNQSLKDMGSECKITPRGHQVTIETKSLISVTHLWSVVCEAIKKNINCELSVVRSTHSVDILAPNITKTAVVDHIVSLCGKGSSILVIGDQAQWPGNDFDLLSGKFSLSVNEVSASINTGWNLCSGGVRGPQGTLEYLRKIECNKGQARIRYSSGGRAHE